MKVLVTGAGGFVGAHMIKELQTAGHEVMGMTYGDETLAHGAAGIPGDINDAKSTRTVVEAARPEGCIHLAGQAFVPKAWEYPQATVQTNVNGTINLLEACRQVVPECRLVVITSSEVYGRAGRDEILDETHGLNPTTLYGVTKVAADLATLTFARHYGIHAVTARPQNHIGPGQSPNFAISSFVTQIAAIARHSSRDATMQVGNLDTMRDFTDVRDVVHAYRLLMENGVSGNAYNIASGRNIRLRWMVEELCRLAHVHPMIKVNPEFFRPTDVPPLLDTQKIRAAVGWIPAIPLSQTLKDLLDAARP